MLNFSENLPTASKTVVSVVASLALSALALRCAERLPDAVESFLVTRVRSTCGRYSSQLTVAIRDTNGLIPNQMFDAVKVYLGTKLASSTSRIDVHKSAQEDEMVVSIDRNEELVDSFKGVKLRWILISDSNREMPHPLQSSDKSSILKPESRRFLLRFPKKHRVLVLESYLPWILSRAAEISEQRKAVKLHTVDYNGPDYWGSINLNHPSTFDTLAMDPDVKAALIEDLDCFAGGKEYYKRTGRAWKRGYLLYGPPGTGKSSLVAAMANYLKYDIYDLDLNEVQCNSDLRRLLIGTGSQSIIVIEDIDCSEESKLFNNDKITLSGLLNFIDGLWSNCGDQRIIVFTTNYKDRLEPALLRPGRMDLHIHMSYCTFNGFKILAQNYLGIREEDHPTFATIEDLLKKVEATPAEIAGELMISRDPEIALKGLVEFLQRKSGEFDSFH